MNLPECCDIHMVGVCGVGMAGVARLLAARGYHVSGCDTSLNALVPALLQAGVGVLKGHDKSHVAALSDNGCLIVTPAVDRNEPELLAARSRKLPVYFRGVALASLVSESAGIAICGTHGKTTTTCFATRLFQELGSNPGWCIGGYTKELGNVASPGDNHLLIVEADESDGTLQFYHPAITVVNNIDIDHLEHFDGEESLVECFRMVIAQSRRGVCVCRDDARAFQTATAVGNSLLDYGLSEQATLQATSVMVKADCSSFDLIYKNINYGRVELGVGGGHNIVNALGAAAAALMYGYTIEEVVRVLPIACSQLPGRRFEEICVVDGVRYVIDYAHHPVELKAAVTMAVACQPKRLIAVFQPHRYTRTLAMGDEFPAAFKGVDEVILLPIYAASEALIEGGDICDLYAHFRREMPELKITLARDLAECWFFLQLIATSGDMVLIAGAGDVIELRDYVQKDFSGDVFSAFESELQRVDRIKLSPRAALSKCSVFPTRGRARYLIEVADSEGLQKVTALCRSFHLRYRISGNGMNSWFSDCGFDGCVIRFAPGAFTQCKITGDVAVVGCGLSGPRLLDILESSGLSGLEFLEGVPGSVGGWLAMNAGAHGSEIGDCVLYVDCINSLDHFESVAVDECGFSYRSCELLRDGVAVGCTLQLKPDASAEIKSKRRQFSEKRIPLQGLRSAGSVFKNPVPDSAGRLLDQAGCKGLRVGGAYVTDFHANIIVVDEGVLGSDVAALTQMMRNRLLFNSNIELETEICGM